MPAARGNGMQLGHYLGFLIMNSLFAQTHLSSRADILVISSEARDPGSGPQRRRLLPLFTRALGQRLHLVLIDLDLARFLHLIAQVADIQREDLLLLALH